MIFNPNRGDSVPNDPSVNNYMDWVNILGSQGQPMSVSTITNGLGTVNSVNPSFTSWNPRQPIRGGFLDPTGRSSKFDNIKNIQPQWRQWINDAIARQTDVQGLDEGLIVSMILAESSGDPGTPDTGPRGNPTRDKGLMQVNEGDRSSNLNRILPQFRKSDLHDVQTNIEVGVAVMASYLKKYKGIRRKL